MGVCVCTLSDYKIVCQELFPLSISFPFGGWRRRWRYIIVVAFATIIVLRASVVIIKKYYSNSNVIDGSVNFARYTTVVRPSPNLAQAYPHSNLNKDIHKFTIPFSTLLHTRLVLVVHIRHIIGENSNIYILLYYL